MTTVRVAVDGSKIGELNITRNVYGDETFGDPSYREANAAADELERIARQLREMWTDR